MRVAVSPRVLFRSLATALCAIMLAGAGLSAAPAQSVVINHANERIVSLVPSLTEDLFAIGAGRQVVGVSTYTDFPAAARALPVVASFSSVNAERIIALHPDVVVGITSQGALVRDLARTGIPIVLLRDDTLDDLYGNLERLGALAHRSMGARALIARLKTRTAELTRAARKRATVPSTFVVLGTAPIFTVGRGSYIAKLIALAGGRNAAEDVGPPYARYSAETLVATQPDLLVVDPDIHFADVVDKTPWTSLRAVREHRVFTLPDAAILERPGPRYNDGLAWLIDVMKRVDGTPHAALRQSVRSL